MRIFALSALPVFYLWIHLMVPPLPFVQGGSRAPQTKDDELDLWIGQMLMVGFRGVELDGDSPVLKQIAELNLGGVVLFDYDVPLKQRYRNILSPNQVKRLSTALQQAAAVPLLIAVDQEGGKVARLKQDQGFEPSRSAADLGKLDEESATREQAARVAKMLHQLGINVNFSPVLDLAVNPENPIIARLGRSFSAQPEKVVEQARWTIEEYHRQGILSAVKHFPGHGSSLQDSHLGLPDVSRTWSRRELEPYSRLIQEGLPDMIMTAHVFHAEWDPRLPATLSPAVIRGMLRRSLGFEGVVVSDDLGMGAISQHYSLEETIELAINAGVDILLFGNNSTYDPDIALKAVGVIRQLVQSERVTRNRILESHQRIQKLKARYPLRAAQ